MIRRGTRILALFIATVACLAIVTSPADADRAVLPDESGDVWFSDATPGADFAEAGSVVNTDLEHTWVGHQRQNVVIKSRFVDLKKKVSEQIEFRIYLRTNHHRQFWVFAQVDTWNGSTSYELLNLQSGGFTKCDGLGGRTRFDTETLRVQVPRTCLVRPRWVRFQGEANSYVENEGLYVDNANGAGPEPRSWTRRLWRG